MNEPAIKRASQRGVALVITVIMVAVITFLTIAFLVLTRREKGAVTTATDQTAARLAAETALERAKTDLLAPILAFTNQLAFDLRVSTNYISPSGFDTAELSDLGRGNGDQLGRYDLHWATNVSFAYPNGKAVLPGTADFAQLMANLFYNPRPPVFVKTNRAQNPAEFRYYLDLNRNGRYDTNGFLPVINTNGLFVTDGRGNVVSNSFVGDPEWIGILERPEFPHSSSNRFVSRFAWIAIPAGKTLDLNSVHNDAKQRPMTAGNDGFLRNQGVGTWEINLGAFLTDLNTNVWDPLANRYNFRTNLTLQNLGAGFDDASALLRFRYGGDFNNLTSVRGLFGPWGANTFRMDMVDGYSAGPLMTGTTPLAVDLDFSRASRPWSGSENPEHFFTTQDFFDPAKNSLPFFNRLSQIGTNTSSYDRYTFYRLLSQLGTDSEPEPPGKMNLNYDNLVRANPVTGAVSVTNFYAWRPIDFFTNAAHRLLWAHTEAWANSNRASFLASFGVTQPFGVTNIPVLVSNRLVYSSSVQRLLQLAANMYDATTNRLDPPPRVSPKWGPVPSIFRPYFRKDGTNVFIAGYVEEPGNTTGYNSIPYDLRSAVDVGKLAPAPALNFVNVYAVPWILSARKGLPNFNEFALQTVFSIVRKLQVHRSSPTETVQVSDLGARNMDQMIVIGISNVVAMEAWNSYRTNYTLLDGTPRPVELIVANDMSLAMTNSDGLRLTTNFIFAPNIVTSNVWPGIRSETAVEAASFVVPLRLNFRYPAPAVYRANPPTLLTNLSTPFQVGAGFPQPRWGMATTNRLRFILRDRDTKQLLDYVQMIGFDSVRDLSSEIAQQVDGTPGMGSIWDTNRVGGSANPSIPSRGIINQIHVSLGDYNSGTVDWTSYGLQPTSHTKQWEIDNFRAFFTLAPIFGNVINNTNLVQQVPFTPALLLSHYQSWQANDPLVHYTPADLRYLAGGNQFIKESVKPGAKVPTLKNIGLVNDRYHPWGGYPPGNSTAARDFNVSLQDPLVRSSDDWDFPTNKLPNIGWLGRVHRGTPWQTVYLKSSPVDAATWINWGGNDNIYDAAANQPVNDRLIFDLFTTALSDTATRGQMSINQSGLAAWSAIFGGVLAVTNTTPDSQLRLLALQPGARPGYSPHVIEPAGAYAANDLNALPALVKIVNDINQTRADANQFPHGTFTRLGDILAVPALTTNSPFLNRSSTAQIQGGLSDAAYERLPQQVMSLLSVGGPRFVIYGYGQALRPADNSVVTSRGPFFGLCTNYQVTAEVGIRAVVRVDGAPANPRLAVESFNVLPPD